jgi:hypothetical protein
LGIQFAAKMGFKSEATARGAEEGTFGETTAQSDCKFLENKAKLSGS